MPEPSDIYHAQVTPRTPLNVALCAIWKQLYTIATAGGGGGGSATAANQATQITAEQAIQALLGGTGLLKVTPATAAAPANVASSASNVTLQASNAARRGLLIFNDSTQVLYVKFGATASSSSYTVQIAAGGYYEVPQPVYTGQVDGIWASANGNARVTELT